MQSRWVQAFNIYILVGGGFRGYLGSEYFSQLLNSFHDWVGFQVLFLGLREYGVWWSFLFDALDIIIVSFRFWHKLFYFFVLLNF
jgi:hypothetical protein